MRRWRRVNESRKGEAAIVAMVTDPFVHQSEDNNKRDIKKIQLLDRSSMFLRHC